MNAESDKPIDLAATIQGEYDPIEAQTMIRDEADDIRRDDRFNLKARSPRIRLRGMS